MNEFKIGDYIVKNSSPIDSRNLDFMATVTFQIGHVFGGGACLINFLTDGGTCIFNSLTELNETLVSYEKGYRLLSDKELCELILFRISQK